MHVPVPTGSKTWGNGLFGWGQIRLIETVKEAFTPPSLPLSPGSEVVVTGTREEAAKVQKDGDSDREGSGEEAGHPAGGCAKARGLPPVFKESLGPHPGLQF